MNYRTYNQMNGTPKWTPERLAAMTKALAFVVTVGILAGVFAVYANLYYVVAAAGVIGITVLAVWKFEATLAIYVLIAFLPWGRTPDLATGGSGQGKGIYISEAVLAYVLGIWLIRKIVSLVPATKLRSGFDIPVLLYTGYSVLCLINGFMFWDSHVDRMYQHVGVNIVELGFRLLSAGAFVMMATSILEARWAKRIAVIALIPGLLNLFNTAIGGKIPGIMAPWWPLLAFLPASFLLAVAIDKHAKPVFRMLSAALVILALFVILVENIGWISGWLGLGVALATVLYIKNKKLFLACAVFAIVAVMMAQPFFQKNVLEESAKSGDYDRFALMRGAMKYATKFPLGVGPGNYRSYNSFYYGQEWGTTAYTSAHGTYSQHLAEMGIPGLILFLAMPIGGLFWLVKRYRKMDDGFPRNFVLGTIGQIAGISAAAIVGDYIIPTYHNNGVVTFCSTVYSWLIWGIAVAYIRINDRETNGSVCSNN